MKVPLSLSCEGITDVHSLNNYVHSSNIQPPRPIVKEHLHLHPAKKGWKNSCPIPQAPSPEKPRTYGELLYGAANVLARVLILSEASTTEFYTVVDLCGRV